MVTSGRLEDVAAYSPARRVSLVIAASNQASSVPLRGVVSPFAFRPIVRLDVGWCHGW